MAHAQPMLVDLRSLPGELLGPVIVSHLAYPGAKQEKERLQTVLRLVPYEVAQAIVAQPDWAALVGRTSLQRLDKFLKSGRTQLEMRLRKRLDVGHVVQSGLAALRDNDGRMLRAGKWSRRKTVDRLHARDDLPPWRNFDQHWWQSCRSILHLAAAWYEALYLDQQKNRDFAGLSRLLEDPEFGRRMLQRAMELEPAMAELQVPSEQLTKFRV